MAEGFKYGDGSSFDIILENYVFKRLWIQSSIADILGLIEGSKELWGNDSEDKELAYETVRKARRELKSIDKKDCIGLIYKWFLEYREKDPVLSRNCYGRYIRELESVQVKVIAESVYEIVFLNREVDYSYIGYITKRFNEAPTREDEKGSSSQSSPSTETASVESRDDEKLPNLQEEKEGKGTTPQLGDDS